ncbi:Protein of unknown function [Gryllus bimaculatus]|nr:Protein of unknown function [Gryllus bimaculatus]
MRAFCQLYRILVSGTSKGRALRHRLSRRGRRGRRARARARAGPAAHLRGARVASARCCAVWAAEREAAGPSSVRVTVDRTASDAPGDSARAAAAAMRCATLLAAGPAGDSTAFVVVASGHLRPKLPLWEVVSAFADCRTQWSLQLDDSYTKIKAII